MKEFVPAVLALARRPMPRCADPSGHYAQFLLRIVEAGNNARSAEGLGGLRRSAAPLKGPEENRAPADRRAATVPSGRAYRSSEDDMQACSLRNEFTAPGSAGFPGIFTARPVNAPGHGRCCRPETGNDACGHRHEPSHQARPVQRSTGAPVQSAKPMAKSQTSPVAVVRWRCASCPGGQLVRMLSSM